MRILVCADGESHSRSAIKKAISLGMSLPAEVTALHVVDPWLKTFYNEIYAQGREQYLEYVDNCLQEIAEQTRRAFNQECVAEGFNATFKVRRGEPLEEILEEMSEFPPDFLITGGKRLNVWGRFKSGNLPLQLQNKIGKEVSMIVVDDI
jgi:nucleotide-binding universal stress UspA family protein|tara:strand:+ start:501 stop:950 length:450 start_codon:yes stop_codon:yes gene_type:complete